MTNEAIETAEEYLEIRNRQVWDSFDKVHREMGGLKNAVRLMQESYEELLKLREDKSK